MFLLIGIGILGLIVGILVPVDMFRRGVLDLCFWLVIAALVVGNAIVWFSLFELIIRNGNG